jgi:hypothetical protein
MCEEYNPDTDISLYASFELQAMLRAIQEGGPLFRHSNPPFSESELVAEISERTAQQVNFT